MLYCQWHRFMSLGRALACAEEAVYHHPAPAALQVAELSRCVCFQCSKTPVELQTQLAWAGVCATPVERQLGTAGCCHPCVLLIWRTWDQLITLLKGCKWWFWKGMWVWCTACWVKKEGEGKKRHIFQFDVFAAWRAWKEHLEITGSKDSCVCVWEGWWKGEGGRSYKIVCCARSCGEPQLTALGGTLPLYFCICSEIWCVPTCAQGTVWVWNLQRC